MKKIIVLLGLALVGCQRANKITSVPSLSAMNPDISLTGVPVGAVLVGNIDELVPVLFNVKLASVAVYLKTSETSGWNFVQPGGTKTPTYVYDTYSHQIRFQWTEAGWAYAIVGQ